MRIIAGLRKGSKLYGPKNESIRPTESRIKESLFNILGDVEHSIVLDLFSGTGSIGLEFLSRGADKVFFVDNNPDAIKIIKKNIEKVNLDGYIIYNGGYSRALKEFENKKIIFDYIFIDPPYGEHHLYENTLKMLNKFNISNDKTKIILECEDTIKIKNLEFYEIIDERKYRSTILYFLRRNS